MTLDEMISERNRIDRSIAAEIEALRAERDQLRKEVEASLELLSPRGGSRLLDVAQNCPWFEEYGRARGEREAGDAARRRVEQTMHANEPPMTPETVKARVDAIAAGKQDYEMAHIQEDEMFREVLKAIADGTCADPRECARVALTSCDIRFPRHCA